MNDARATIVVVGSGAAGLSAAELLGDDRGIGLDVDRESLEADDPARARGGRHALGHERLERGHRLRQAQLVVETERPRGIGHQVADADHRVAALGSRVARPRRPGGRPESGSMSRAPPPLDPHLPGRPDGPQLRVEVVEGRRRDEGLRQGRDPPDEMGAAIRVELGEDVVEQQERRPAVVLGQQVELGELERRGSPSAAGRATRSRPGRGRPGSKTRSSRCGPTSVAPFQTSLSAVSTEPAGQGVPRRLARGAPGRSSRSGASGPPPAASSGAISAWAAASGAARRSRRTQPVGHDPTAGVEERLVPEPQLVAARAFLADRAQQAVALLERPAVRREGASRTRDDGRCASWSSDARRSPGEPTMRSISSGAKTTTRSGPSSAPARRPEAVHPDPLPPARAGRAGPGDRHLDRVVPRRGPRPGPGPCPSGSARRPPTSDAIGPRRAGRSPRAGSSCRPRSGPTTRCGPGPKATSSGGIPPEVEQADGVEQGLRGPAPPGRPPVVA